MRRATRQGVLACPRTPPNGLLVPSSLALALATPDRLTRSISRLPPCLSKRLCAELEKLETRLRADHQCPDLELHITPPKKLDANLWKNRHACEEMADLMKRPPAASAILSSTDAASVLGEEFQELHDFIANFQKGHTERVTNLILQYLPQDFRGSLIRQQKERSDEKRKAEVEALVAGGCTIKEKYDLLWQQQMAKRESLKGLASSSGVFKAVVSFVGGIPQVLLDFLEKINDDNGPLAEQRVRYGPAFYQLTSLSNRIHSLVATWWAAQDPKALSEVESTLVSLVQEASGGGGPTQTTRASIRQATLGQRAFGPPRAADKLW